MKHIKFYQIAILFVMLAFTSCSSEPDYKKVRQEVIDLHDKLMVDGEMAIRNKMALDTLSIQGLSAAKKSNPTLDTTAEKEHIKKLVAQLKTADDNMMDWMQDFKADIEGMNNAQAVTYFQSEKIKLVKMDSLYKIALDGSKHYLQKFGVNIHPLNDGHDHSKH